MTAKEKLILELKNNPLFKDIEIDDKNVLKASFYEEKINICKHCKGLDNCFNEAKGMMPLFDGKELTYTSCKFKKLENKLKLVNANFASNYLKDAKLSEFNLTTKERIKCKEFAEKFILDNKKDIGLYLYGSFGTGKTYYLSALANELALNDISSIIVFMPDLSRDLKNAMFDNSLEKKVWELKKVPVLMLDDFGGEMMTSWLRDEIIAPIIQYRMVNHLPIFITSNLDYDGLHKKMLDTKDDYDNLKAARIIERIKKMTKRCRFSE